MADPSSGHSPGCNNRGGLGAHQRCVCSIRRVAGRTQAPKFRVDPTWPKIPNNWQFGQVASVSIDAQDHVWVLQRPGTLSPEEKRGLPPRCWNSTRRATSCRRGAVRSGYEWPSPEHGVYVDPKGFVWIGGTGQKDNQILKFTKAGKFVMQIGRAGQSKGNADTENLNQPADTFVYAKTNELFVADGYGNRRVIVFDADSGKFKRMWGAFGNVPTDAAPNPAMPDADQNGRRSSFSLCMRRESRTTAWSTSPTAAASGFRCSRSMASIVNQVFIGRDCKAPECGNGTTAASTAFSTDPSSGSSMSATAARPR